MATHSVNVLVKARDEASRKFNTIGRSATGMGKMLRRAAAGLIVYFSARAIKSFAEETLSLYGQQEAAVKSLSDALDLLGQGGSAAMKDMQEFASSIQKITIYGDEALLEVMAMGSAMGKLSGDTLKKATKAAIGLAKAYKMDLTASMRLVARAAAGDTASLARYGIKLGEGLTAQEKFNKVLEIGVENFVLAKGEVDTYRGAIAQMKNALGDVKEVIGEALQPAFRSMSKTIKKWSEDNKKAIGEWSQKIMSYLELVKDMFISFVDFMREDWRAGMSFVFDSFLILLKTTFDSAVTLAIAGGKGIWAGVKEGLLGGKDKQIERLTEKLYLEWAKNAPAGTLLEGLGPPLHRTAAHSRFREEAEKQFLAEQTRSALGSTMDVLTDSWKAAFKEVMEAMPPELKKEMEGAFAAHRARLEAIGKEAPGEDIRSQAAVGSVDEIIKQLLAPRGKLQAEEARFLTFAPGTRFDKTERFAGETAKNTGKLTKLTEKMVAEIRSLGNSLQGGAVYAVTDFR